MLASLRCWSSWREWVCGRGQARAPRAALSSFARAQVQAAARIPREEEGRSEWASINVAGKFHLRAVRKTRGHQRQRTVAVQVIRSAATGGRRGAAGGNDRRRGRMSSCGTPKATGTVIPLALPVKPKETAAINPSEATLTPSRKPAPSASGGDSESGWSRQQIQKLRLREPCPLPHDLVVPHGDAPSQRPSPALLPPQFSCFT
jgi:hypothetical protein